MDQNLNDNNTVSIGDDRTRLQVLSLINDCNKYKMDLTTNGVVITDAIKFVQTNKEKLSMSTKEEDKGSKENKEPDYADGEDNDHLEEKQEEETERQENNKSGFLIYSNLYLDCYILKYICYVDNCQWVVGQALHCDHHFV